MIWMTRYWKAALVPLLIFGAFLLRLSGARAASRKIESKINEAKAEHAKNVMTADNEFEQEHDSRTEDLAKQVESDGVSDELSKPNEW